MAANKTGTIQHNGFDANGDPREVQQDVTDGATHVAASPAEAEVVDISGGDHTFAITCMGLYVGVAGDVKVDFADVGTAIVLTALPVGFHPMNISKVYQTGTAATNMVGLGFTAP